MMNRMREMQQRAQLSEIAQQNTHANLKLYWEDKGES